MQFQCFQIRLKSQESCKFVNIVGAALREIAVDKFSQLEPIVERKRQHDMSRRLNTQILGSCILASWRSSGTTTNSFKFTHMFIVDARRAMSSLAKSNANGGGKSKTRPVTFVARWRFSSDSGTPVFDVAGASKTWKTVRKFSPGFISEGMWDVAGEVQVDSFENLILTYERKYLRGTRLEIRTRHTSNSWVATGRVSPCPNLNTQIFLSYLILEHTK